MIEDPQTPQADPWADCVRLTSTAPDGEDCYLADEVDAARATVECQHAEEVRGLRAAIRYLEDTTTANSALTDERREHAEQIDRLNTYLTRLAECVARREQHCADLSEQLATKDAELSDLVKAATRVCDEMPLGQSRVDFRLAILTADPTRSPRTRAERAEAALTAPSTANDDEDEDEGETCATCGAGRKLHFGDHCRSTRDSLYNPTETFVPLPTPPTGEPT